MMATINRMDRIPPGSVRTQAVCRRIMPPRARHLRNRDGFAAIVIYYILFGACWILFSDLLVSKLTSEPAVFSRISIGKGWLFIAVTALLLYVLIKRRVRMVLDLQSKHIEEIEERERRITHANRLYAVLSSVNRSIIRTSGQQELLDEICRILVAVGGYKTAWVGWPDEDGLVIPRASSGDGSGYLETIRISVRDIPEGRGPTGTAIRERRPVVCDSIAGNPTMEIWRGIAIRNGFASSACFPFVLPDGTVAGLTIYSAEPAFFNSDEERLLLGEVADDMVYALHMLNTAAAHRVAEQRLKEVLDNSPAVIYAFDRDGHLLLANAAMAALCAGTAEQLQGLPREEIGISPESARLQRSNDLFVLATGEPQVFEETNLQGDGMHTYLTVKFPLTSVSDDVSTVVAGISTDITERKRAEVELNKIRRLHSETERIGNVGGWEFDIDSGVQTWTEEVYRIHEVESTFIPSVDRGIAFYTPESRVLIENALQRAIEYGEPFDLELEIITARGNVKQVNAIGKSEPGHNKIIGFFQDITKRKKTEMELQKKNAEIEQFIYTVSHDLRSPLVTIKTFMGYLEKDMAGSDREPLVQDIQFINAAADKMKMLLDELLEMSRIGRIETPPAKVSLSEILDEVLDTLAGVITERAVEIHLPSTDLMLFGDRLRLCQIWQNLIENSIKFCSSGSAPRLELGVEQVSGDPVFFVKDNGIGIAPEYRARIFGLFEKLNPKIPGAGLGLSMIQRVVEKYNGRIWADSEGVDKGSRFCFTLPKALSHD